MMQVTITEDSAIHLFLQILSDIETDIEPNYYNDFKSSRPIYSDNKAIEQLECQKTMDAIIRLRTYMERFVDDKPRRGPTFPNYKRLNWT